MANLQRIPARSKSGAFHVVIESPRGSTVKLKYEPELEAFTMSRPLVLGLSYPFDWGFVPSTHAPDGDPLDAMVLHDAATYPGVILPCRALGVLQVSQKKKGGKPGERERNDRVIAVPEGAPRLGSLRGLDDLSERTRRELEQFFLMAVALNDKEAKIEGWAGAEEAERLVDETEKSAR